MSVPFLDAVREAAGPRVWDAAVRLARDGAVIGVSDDGDEVSLHVRQPNRALPHEVTLWPDEPDWGCDCNQPGDACLHVAAATIALTRSRAEGQTLPAPSVQFRVDIVYLFRAIDGKLAVRRLIREADGTETPLSGALAQTRFVATTSDTHAETLLVRHGDLPLEPDLLRRLLPFVAGRPARLDGADIRVSAEALPFRIRVTDDGEGFRVALSRPQGIDALFRGAARIGDVLRPTTHGELLPEQRRMLANGVHYDPAEVAALVSTVLPQLRRRAPMDVETARLPNADALTPRVSVRLTPKAHGLEVFPELFYGDPPIARITPSGGMERLSDAVVPARDPGAERQATRAFEERFGRPVGYRTIIAPVDAPGFLTRLHRDHTGPLTGDVDPAVWRVVDQPLVPRVRVETLPNGFRLDLEFEGPGAADPNAVLDAWRAGRSLVPLLDGGFAPLPADWLNTHGDVLRELMAQREANGRVPRSALPALVELMGDAEVDVPPDLARLHEFLAHGSGLPEEPVPAALEATLRPYQIAGFRWVRFLATLGFHGILADDMGLGKTLQTMAVLLADPEGPHLVVAPTSVLRTWQDELRRFAPTVAFQTYHGADRSLLPVPITLTTYSLLRLDQGALSTRPWRWLVLDEAQAIKNATSQTARAAFALRSEHRLTLSGTPVENRLEELWSQFRFLMPGLLGSLESFRERFARPIEAGDAAARVALRSRVRPYMMRRLKAQVAPELPSLTERVERIELPDDQRRFYEATRLTARHDVMRALSHDGDRAGMVHVLEALLRMRQAACDPFLVPGSPPDLPAAKLDRLEELLVETTIEGHKVLVFSQWTSLLDRVEPRLQALGIDFLRLDGSTLRRRDVVDRFQSPEGPPVFLLSLKAGGTGLNLTAADYVIHLDPWWNPAVERQATDRAHRIGQHRPVVAIRLVSAGTVEERILDLQAAKRSLADAAIDDVGGFIRTLSGDEIRALFEPTT